MEKSLVTPPLQSCSCKSATARPEEIQSVADIVTQLKDHPGNLIPILQQTQRVLGYIPVWAMHQIGDSSGESYAKIFGIVTFYSYFSRKPRGKNLIRVCMGTACYIRGAQEVLDAFVNKLGVAVGGTTPDLLFTLECARCFGACGLAPAVSINDKVYKNVQPSKVGAIVDEYYKSSAVTAGVSE